MATSQNGDQKQKMTIGEANKDIRKLFDDTENMSTYGWSGKYMNFGDVEDFSFNEKDGVLTVYATGKAYSYKPATNTVIQRLSETEFQKAKDKAFKVSHTKEPIATDEYGATRLARMYEKRGFKVSKIILHKEWD